MFEDHFARLQRMLQVSENGIVPSRPNSPEQGNNDFREERFLDLSFEQIDSIKDIPLD